MVEVCGKAFYSSVIILMHMLRVAWELDEDTTRFFQFCHRTYRDGAALYRQNLIAFSNRWEELGLAG